MKAYLTISLLLFCFLATLSAEGDSRRSRRERNRIETIIEKKEQAAKSPTKEKSEPDSKKLGRLGLLAREMMIEGEGHRQKKPISGVSTKKSPTCPVCSQRFIALDIENQKPELGMDRDFCKYSKAKSTYDFDVWSCSKCGYSNFKNYFEEPVSDELIAFSEETLEKAMRRMFKLHLNVDIEKMGFLMEQNDIPTSIKYYLMEMCLPYLKLKNRVLAKFYLQFAWVERKRFVELISNTEFVVHHSIMQKKMRKLKKELGLVKNHQNPVDLLAIYKSIFNEARDDEDRMLIYIYQANQLDRMGYPGEALTTLKKAVKLKLLKSHRKIVQFKKKVLVHEFELLKKALLYIKEAFREGEFPANYVPEYTYLIGEIYRRLGLSQESWHWFNAAIKISDSEPFLNKWAREQKKLLPKQLSQHSKIEETEGLLIERVLRSVRSRASTEDPTQTHEVERVNVWLEILHSAVSSYYRKLEFHPDGIGEIVELGLVQGHSELEKVAGEIFHIIVNKKMTRADFTSIVCDVSFEDREGSFWLMITRDRKLGRLRKKPLFKD